MANKRTTFARFTSIVLLLLIAFIGIRPSQAQGTALTLRIWHSYSGDYRDTRALDRLTEWTDAYRPNANIDFELEYVPAPEMGTRFAAATIEDRPDILIAPSDYSAGWYANAYTASVETMITGEFRAYVPQAAWDTVFYRNRRVAIPFAVTGSAIYYHRVLVAEDVPETIQELTARIKALHAPDKFITGLYMRPAFTQTVGLYLGIGGVLIDPLSTVTLPGVQSRVLSDVGLIERYLTTVKELWTTGTDQAYRNAISRRTVIAGTVAFWIGDTEEAEIYRQALGDDLGVLPLIRTFNGTWRPLFRTWAVHIGASSRYMDEVRAFASFITGQAGDEAQAMLTEQANSDLSFLPLSPVALSNSIQGQLRDDLIERGQPLPARPDTAAYFRVMQDALNGVLVNRVDPARAADQVVAAAKLIPPGR